MTTIIPMLLSDNELKFFDEEEYCVLNNLMNEYIARQLYKYCNNPDADKEVVSQINRYCGKKMNGIINTDFFKDPNIQSLIKDVMSMNMTSLTPDEQVTMQNKLKKIESVLENCETEIQPRNKEDYDKFCRLMVVVVEKVKAAGLEPICNNISESIKQNSEVLYKRYEGTRTLPSKIAKRFHTGWYSSKRALEWNDYCNENKIPIEDREIL